MEKPTFKEWLDSNFRTICDVTVKRYDGEIQNILDCNFDYGYRGNELITKKGYKISDYFFVDQVIGVFNFREAL